MPTSEVCVDDQLDGDLLLRALEIPSRSLEEYHHVSKRTREIGDVCVVPAPNQVRPAKLPTRNLQQGQKLDARR